MHSRIRTVAVLSVPAVAGTGVAVAANPATPHAAPSAAYYTGTSGYAVAPFRYDAAIRDDSEWGDIHEAGFEVSSGMNYARSGKWLSSR
ncbi:hypothetical protein [Streptomyces sp. NPDC059142]|uniref:hypothetical protein n=1 Tax=Streptomyces sp. NPDC059142 TaxID=3346739 RepID=UPI003683D5B2